MKKALPDYLTRKVRVYFVVHNDDGTVHHESVVAEFRNMIWAKKFIALVQKEYDDPTGVTIRYEQV